MKIPDCYIQSFNYFAAEAGETTWRIKWQGRYLSVRSGKSAWKTRSFAMSALIQHCMYGSEKGDLAKENGRSDLFIGCSDFDPEFRKLVVQMIAELEKDKQIEFVQIQ